MITRILLRNFQKHRKLDLGLERIVTFVGESDAGKSSVLRALRWVCSNSPKGNSFIRNGAKFCSVTIWIDGHKIKRSKKGSSNTYAMDGHTYHSFASGVPEAIANVLRVSPENFQQQHDPIFWLSLSPSEVSKRLNEIADLHVMDDSIKKSLAIKKEATHRVKFCKEQRKAAKNKLIELAYVPQLMEQWQAVKQLQTNLDTQRTRYARLDWILLSIAEASEVAESLETVVQEASALSDLSLAIIKKKCRLSLIRRGIEAAKVDVPELNLDSDFSYLKQQTTVLSDLRDLIQTIKEKEKEVSQCSKRLRTLKDSTKKLDCPACGRPM